MAGKPHICFQAELLGLARCRKEGAPVQQDMWRLGGGQSSYVEKSGRMAEDEGNFGEVGGCAGCGRPRFSSQGAVVGLRSPSWKA